MRKYSYLIIGFLLLSTTACSVVDNYMLGKDNTQKPSELKTITNTIPVRLIFSSKIGSGTKPYYYDNRIYTSTNKGLVKCLDAKTAKLIWSKKLSYTLNNNPVANANILILTTTNNKVLALSPKNGNILWKTKVRGEILANPVLLKNTVYIKTMNGELYSISLQTGKKNWVSSHGAPNFVLKASSEPVMARKYLLVGFSDGQLDAIDYNTGEILWQRNIAFGKGASDIEQLVDIDANPIVEGDIVYIGTYQGYLGAFSLNTSEWIWQQPASIYKNMLLDHNYLYFVDADDVLWCIRKNDGSVEWQQREFIGHNLTSPIVVGNFLVLSDKTGLLHVLNKSNGDILARAVVSKPVTVTPILTSNNIVDIITTNGKLLRYKIGY